MYKFAILVCIGLVGFSACDLELLTKAKEETGFTFDEETFNSNWDEWRNNNIQNYSFTMKGELEPVYFRAYLMTPYEVNIVVKNGVMDSFEFVGKTSTDGISALESEFTSVSDMYQKIHDYAQVHKEELKKDSHRISIKYEIIYDAELKYIRFWEPVFKYKPGTLVDSLWHPVTISNFTVLDGDRDE
jgi:hypothetical protein